MAELVTRLQGSASDVTVSGLKSRSMCSARSVADSYSLITLNNFQIIVSDVSREFSGAIRLSHIIKFELQMYNFGASR